MLIAIDPEFKRLIPSLLPEEFKQLEANILQDGCQEPLSIWRINGENILIDGHNRYKICEKRGKRFQTVEIELADRDHAKLWIARRQLGRRNLTDSQRKIISADIAQLGTVIAEKERGVQAAKDKALRIRLLQQSQKNQQDNVSVKNHTNVKPIENKQDNSKRTIAKVASEAKLAPDAVRKALDMKKKAPEVANLVRSGGVTFTEGRKLAALPVEARKVAVAAVGAGTDVRTAIRAAKKEDYNATVAKEKPKVLEGTYRIIYADPPWKYVGLNQADEYGHAERHYDCLDDEQLKKYKPGKGARLVKDVADKNAVLFLWVTSPLLERCFAIIEAWGFEYKASFVWDKIKHNMGHYNSVRHEFLLICTKGACKPDVPKLVDSVQSIERQKHSQKPVEFVKIIEELYDHGRKLELFCREPREGWDADGNEV